MKAYLVLDLTIHDLPRFMEYIERIPELIKKHGGAIYRARYATFRSRR